MKINWGISIGSVYVFFAGSMILFAIRASKETNDLVSDKYYEDAVDFQKKIIASDNAQSEENSLRVNFLPDNNSLLLESKSPSVKTSGKISFYKPDNASLDFELPIDLLEDKQFVDLDTLAHGTWRIKLNWNNGEKDFYAEKLIVIKQK